MPVLKNVLGSLFAAGILVTSTAAFADGRGHGHEGPKGGGDKPAAAPELAGKGAPAALALIAGGAAIVISRRRRQS